jgi:hypothetical protein
MIVDSFIYYGKIEEETRRRAMHLESELAEEPLVLTGLVTFLEQLLDDLIECKCMSISILSLL